MLQTLACGAEPPPLLLQAWGAAVRAPVCAMVCLHICDWHALRAVPAGALLQQQAVRQRLMARTAQAAQGRWRTAVISAASMSAV